LKLLSLLVALSLFAASCGDDDEGGTGGGGGGGEEPSGLPDTFPDFEEPTKGGRLQMAMNDNIDCYSGLSYYGISWSLFYFMTRGLYGYPNSVEQPDTDTVEPHLAADMPEISDDGMTYTVTLRDGLTFPDGSPVTSADVKATFEYMLDPNIQCATGGPPSSGYYNVLEGYDEFTKALTDDPAADADLAGVRAVDDLTTEFTLTKADGGFLRALAMGWAFIRKADTPHQILESSKDIQYVGPYRITDYQVDKTLTIDREPTWADNVDAGVPEEDWENNIDGIDLRIKVPDDTQLDELKDGDIDLTYDSSAPIGSDIPDVAGDAQFEGRFFSVPDAAIDYLTLRTDKPPFDDVDVRKAASMAIDREALVRIWGGELTRSPWSEMISSNLFGEDKEPFVYERDVEGAKALLEGVDNLDITLLHFTDDPGPELAAAMEEQLEEVGFNVTLQGVSADVIYGIHSDPESKHHIGMAAWGQDFADAVTYYVPLLGCPGGVPSGSNYSFFCDEGIQGEAEEIMAMETGDERTAAWADLSSELTEEHAPWITITNRRKVLLVSERLGNFIWGPAKQWYFANYFLRE
jgi:peptide/nickel transport system substrate-binding protein/oligopeptide transport system substrate-binding protein